MLFGVRSLNHLSDSLRFLYVASPHVVIYHNTWHFSKRAACLWNHVSAGFSNCIVYTYLQPSNLIWSKDRNKRDSNWTFICLFVCYFIVCINSIEMMSEIIPNYSSQTCFWIHNVKLFYTWGSPNLLKNLLISLPQFNFIWRFLEEVSARSRGIQFTLPTQCRNDFSIQINITYNVGEAACFHGVQWPVNW